MYGRSYKKGVIFFVRFFGPTAGLRVLPFFLYPDIYMGVHRC